MCKLLSVVFNSTTIIIIITVPAWYLYSGIIIIPERKYSIVPRLVVTPHNNINITSHGLLASWLFILLACHTCQDSKNMIMSCPSCQNDG